MGIILKTIFSNSFSSMKIVFIDSDFSGNCSQLTMSQHLFRSWLSADLATSHYLKLMFAFHFSVAGCLNSLPKCTRKCTFHTVKIMAADDLAPLGARASEAMVLTQFAQDAPVSVPEGFSLEVLEHLARCRPFCKMAFDQRKLLRNHSALNLWE